MESRAAGLKAANTWHASHAIQEAREACGGAGYMAENRLIALRADTDVFTTFEGDNHVLTQLVAKELLTAYADDIKGMSPVEWVRFAANTAGERVLKRTAAEAIMQTDRGRTPGQRRRRQPVQPRHPGQHVRGPREIPAVLGRAAAAGQVQRDVGVRCVQLGAGSRAARGDGPHRPNSAGSVRRRDRLLRRRRGPRVTRASSATSTRCR